MCVRLIVGQALASTPGQSAPVGVIKFVFPDPRRSIGGRTSLPFEASRAATQRLAFR